jgi:hypothetical protein
MLMLHLLVKVRSAALLRDARPREELGGDTHIYASLYSGILPSAPTAIGIGRGMRRALHALSVCGMRFRGGRGSR